MPQDLTPQQLAAVLQAASQAKTQEEYNAILQAVGLGGGNPLEYRQSQNWQYSDPNNPENSQQYLGDPIRQITQQIGAGGSSTGSHTWDPVTGKYTGLSSGMSENAQMLMALTMLAGGAYGAYASGAGAGAGAGAAGGMSGMDMAADAGMGSINSGGGALWGPSGGVSGMDLAADAGMGSVNSGGGTALGSAGTAGATGAGVTGATGAASAGTGAATTGLGTSAAGTAAQSLLGNANAGGLLGSVLGYLDSKDKQQTQSRDPWAPMQPYLLGLANDGAGIYNQLKQQPFSQSQQTAYGNVGNVLDFINANAGGLMSGFNANASGANQFSRNNPRRSLIGNSYDPGTSPVAWQPGLLGSFGTKKG